jgi:hypothetical protein
MTPSPRSLKKQLLPPRIGRFPGRQSAGQSLAKR